MLVLDLIQNIAILLALSVAYEELSSRFGSNRLVHRAVNGVLFGAVAVIGMMTPLVFAPGVIYDGRSIILCAAGYIGGGTIALIASVISIAYRLYLGGVGVVPGLLVVLESAFVGALFHYIRRRNRFWEQRIGIWLIGIIVHLVMLVLQLLLPVHMGERVISTLGFSVLMIYPIGLVLVLRLFLNREELQKTKENLISSEMRYRTLFEDFFTARLIVEPESEKILDANQAASDFYGWSKDELCTMRLRDLRFASEYPGVESRDPGSPPGSVEQRHRLRDSSVREVAVYSHPVELAEGNVLSVMVLDVTERNRLNREHYLLSFCLDNAVIGVFRVTDPEGKILWANKNVSQSLGYTEAELLDLSVFDIDPELTADEWHDHLIRLHEQGFETVERMHRRKDGTFFPAEVSTTWLQYDNQLFIFAFVKDISRRKKAESRLLESLQQKDSLLHEIHHRVRNNLALINSFVNLQRDDPESMADADGALQKTSDRILAMGMIHNLLYEHNDLSHLNFSAFLKMAAEELRSTYCADKDVAINFETDKIFLDVRIALPLGLLVNELITNAFKHAFNTAEKGEVRISFSRQQDGRYLFVVKDDGPGVAADAFPANRKKLGMRLIQVLAMQLDAEVLVRNNGGTLCEVFLPEILSGN